MFCGRLRLVLQTNPYSYSTKLNFTRPRLRKLRFRNKLTKNFVFASALGGSALAIGYIGMYSGISPYMSIVQDPPPPSCYIQFKQSFETFKISVCCIS